MNEYPNMVKESLNSIISQMASSPALFVSNPEKDFTRKRKLPFDKILKLIISMGGNSIYKELLESQGYDVNTATTSAFGQQREKVLPFAFEFLLHEFTDTCSKPKTYRGYRLLAADGSDLHISTDPGDVDTYFQSRQGIRGYNLLHLNALFDLCSRLYVDALIQPGRRAHERKALIDMVDRSHIKGKVIVVADRNYENYNAFAHIENKGWNYVIRVKDLGSNGILSGLSLPSDGEFDIVIHRILTRKQTKDIKARPDLYRFMPSNQVFDFLDVGSKGFYSFSFRVARFRITDNSYETVITNLSQSDFSAMDLKEIYRLRWGIETSFRELKYTVGLTNFHAKKQECILQEIFARIIMYNFAEMITSYVFISRTDTLHTYQVNFTVAFHVCRHFFRLWTNAPPPDVEALIMKNILPVRPGRSDARNIRHKPAVSFIYRIS